MDLELLKTANFFAEIVTWKRATDEKSTFDEDPRLGVLTTTAVLAGAPILMVSHDADDGGWQFLCGTKNDPSDGRIVHLEEIMIMDPTVAEVADIPLGWIAYRGTVGGEWTREPQE